MNKFLKILGAVFIVGGFLWLMALFTGALGQLPVITAAGGVLALIFGFVMLYKFGFAEAQQTWDEGRWVTAAGNVVSFDNGGLTKYDDTERVKSVKLRLICQELGEFTTRMIVLDSQEEEFPEITVKGTPVEALVRSNDKKNVDLVTVAGKNWN